MNNEDLKDIVIKSKEIIAQGYGETYQEFIEVTNHDELLIVILRSHLYIERELIKILGKAFEDESYKSLTFSQKVELCNSLCLIEKEKIGALRKLNKQRNGYAHSLEFNLTERDFEELLSTLSKGEKELYEYEYKNFYELFEIERSLKNNYRILLASIWASIHMDNMFFFAKYGFRSNQIVEREVQLLLEE